MSSNEPLAIVGLGCRFPGGVETPEAFWRLLSDGVDAITEIPEDRWSIPGYCDRPGRAGRSYSRWGGFLDRIDGFEPQAFGISPREAPYLDPQQRLLLETAFEAIEDAGIPAPSLAGTPTGVFIGASTHDYQTIQSCPGAPSFASAFSATGSALSIISNRISYCFDLRGPSFTVDTACSSALVALNSAARAVWNGECTRALVGGVNLLIGPEAFISFSAASMLSPDGRCKAFDASANGFVRAEGAATVLLKPLAAAVADGDRIYAQVVGVGTNQDGRTSGIAMPNGAAQEDLLLQVYRDSGVEPSSVSYVEAHGTGTAIGDPIEVAALSSVLARDRTAADPLVIGSVKTNIGHLEAGSGIAGLLKLVLMLHHARIVPNLHFDTPNPAIDFSGLTVPTEGMDWTTNGHRRVAGINSFGFGGSNAHAILEERPSREPEQVRDTDPARREAWLLPVSARSEESLAEFAGDLAGTMERESAHDVLHTLVHRRTAYPVRAAVVGRTSEELADRLLDLADGADSDSVIAPTRSSPWADPVFVFCGQGSQWPAMGRELLDTEPVFADVLGVCDDHFRREEGWSLLDRIMTGDDEDLQRTALAQPAIFAVQVALTALLESWGIRPAAVVGHSIGEISAAVASGCFTLEDGLHVIQHRAGTMQEHARTGTMMVVGLPLPELEPHLAGRAGVEIAALNSDSLVTLAGQRGALEALEEELAESRVFTRFLRVSHAFHSETMDPVEAPLLAALGRLEPRETEVPFFSTVVGDVVGGSELTADYWWRNVRSTVRFSDALRAAARAGHSAFLEIGPHPVLASSIKETAVRAGHEVRVFPTLERGRSADLQLLTATGRLFAAGAPVAWDALGADGGAFVRLPRHPWSRERYWSENPRTRAARLQSGLRPFLGRRTASASPTWEAVIDLRGQTLVKGHRYGGQVLMPAAGFIDLCLSAGLEILEGESCTVGSFQIHQGMVVPEDGSVTVQTQLDPADSTIRIRATQDEESADWIDHVTAHVRPAHPSEPAPVDLDAIRARCADEWDVREWYSILTGPAIDLGPAFQCVTELHRRDGETLARIELAEAHRAEQRYDATGHAFHPLVLDGCLQVLTATLPWDTWQEERPAYLPRSVERIRLHRPYRNVVWGHVRLLRQGGTSLTFDIDAYDEDGNVLLEMESVTCTRTATSMGSKAEEMGRLVFDTHWHLDPGARSTGPTDLVSAEGLREVLPSTDGSVLERAGDVDAERELITRYLLDVLDGAGLGGRPGDTLAWAPGEDGSSEVRDRVIEVALEWVERAGAWEPDGDGGWRIVEAADRSALEAAWADGLRRQPRFLLEWLFLDALGRRMADVARGGVTDELLLTDELRGRMGEVLRDGEHLRPLFTRLQQAVARIAGDLPEERALRIVETGFGPRTFVDWLAPALPERRTAHTVTEGDDAWLADAAAALEARSWAGTAPPDQLGEAGPFDLLLVGPLADETAEGAASRVRPGGLILRTEPRDVPPLMQLLASLTGRIPPASGTMMPGSQVIGAPAPGPYRLVTGGPTERPGRDAPCLLPPAGAAPGQVLLVSDDGALAEEIVDAVDRRRVADGSDGSSAGPPTRTVERGPTLTARLDRLADEEEALPTVIVWMATSGAAEKDPASVLERDVQELVELVQAVQDRPWHVQKLVVLTRGAVGVGEGSPTRPGHMALHALARVLRNELAGTTVRSIDLPSADDDAVAPGEVVAWELGSEDGQEEVAWRHGSRFVPRLEARRPETRRVEADPTTPEGDHCRVRKSLFSTPDRPAFVFQEPRAVGPTEFRLKVAAAAMNFRDLLKLMGFNFAATVAGDYIGEECVGTVVEVGPDVTRVRVGDRVLTHALGTFGSYAVGREEWATILPENFGFLDAASLPIPLLTVYHAFHGIARIQPGESVLIHSAAGGVGLAAVYLVQMSGARIIATAGTEEKRELLRRLGVEHVFDSHSLDFVDDVARVTDGRGVDVVLNSLAGDALRRSLECVATGGRFIEIGKRDLFADSKIGLYPFRKNIAFQTFDLSQIIHERVDIAHPLFDRMVELCEEKGYPPLPHRVYPASRLLEAFRYMRLGKHIGRLVIDFSDPMMTAEIPGGARRTPDGAGTYVVVGGFGGLGRQVCRWLADRGVRHIAVLSRSGGAAPEARGMVDDLGQAGVEVRSLRADVSDRPSVRDALAEVRGTMPPIRGVLHLAMAIDDALAVNLTPERISRVIVPKARGAWTLHEETADDDLDLFLLFGSVSASLGNFGQAAYAAANEFLVGLSQHRRAAGLPATVIRWGLLSEVGYAAEKAELLSLAESRGILGTTAEDTRYLLDLALEERVGDPVAGRFDWPRIGRTFADRPGSHGLLDLLVDETSAALEAGDGQFRQRLESLPAAEAGSVLMSFLREQVGLVTGASPAGIDPRQDLQEMGLDSLMTVELVTAVEKHLGITTTSADISRTGTLETLAQLLLERTRGGDPEPAGGDVADTAGRAAGAPRAGAAEACLVPLTPDPDATSPVLLCLHASDGQLGVYQEFVDAWTAPVPLYGLSFAPLERVGYDYADLGALAATYADTVVEALGGREAAVFGFSWGGLLAGHLAAALERRGVDVTHVGVADVDPSLFHGGNRTEALTEMIVGFYRFAERTIGAVRPLDDDALTRQARAVAADISPEAVMDWLISAGHIDRPEATELLRRYFHQIGYHLSKAVARRHHPVSPIDAPIHLWRAARGVGASLSGWTEWTAAGCEETLLDCGHADVVQTPYVERLVEDWHHRLVDSGDFAGTAPRSAPGAGG